MLRVVQNVVLNEFREYFCVKLCFPQQDHLKSQLSRCAYHAMSAQNNASQGSTRIEQFANEVISSGF